MTRILVQLISRVTLACVVIVVIALAIGRLLPSEPELLFTASFNLGDLNIYRMNLVRHIMVTVTHNPASDFLPDWSPDGQQIAFVSDRDGRRGVYIIDAAGHSTRRLVESDSNQYNPVWSPDGQYLAYVSEEKGYSEIMLYDLASASPENLTNSYRTNVNPVWSPDGKSITFVSDLDERWNTKIYRLDIATHVISPILVGSATNPIWSPDGRYLLYISGYEKPNLYLWDNDTQKSSLLYEGDFVSNDTPTWTSDGRSIVFSGLTTNGFSGLFQLTIEDCLRDPATCTAHLLTPIPAFYRNPIWKPTQTASPH